MDYMKAGALVSIVSWFVFVKLCTFVRYSLGHTDSVFFLLWVANVIVSLQVWTMTSKANAIVIIVILLVRD